MLMETNNNKNYNQHHYLFRKIPCIKTSFRHYCTQML